MPSYTLIPAPTSLGDHTCPLRCLALGHEATAKASQWGSVQLSSELERPQVGAFDAGGSALGQMSGPRLAGPECFMVIEVVRPVWQRTVIHSGAYILLRQGFTNAAYSTRISNGTLHAQIQERHNHLVGTKSHHTRQHPPSFRFDLFLPSPPSPHFLLLLLFLPLAQAHPFHSSNNLFSRHTARTGSPFHRRTVRDDPGGT